ncbi:MAG: YdiU family protein [Alphaproteobacteria bacterium]|nr:YdiU family protein [Alphaproteobacteria bacterium]
MTFHFPFENTYARLPDRFYARVVPTPVRAPRLIRVNTELALNLGLDPDWLAGPEGLEVLAGRVVPEAAEPIAMAYAGHQFGHFVPHLGDGRAILLGEVIDQQGVRRDVQLKGSGRTPFSRGGDGRAALGPVLREYVVSEAMAALGIPTTRSLAAVVTGETVARETPLPGAVLTRVATSHVRIGTFQFFAARGDLEGLRLLADYVISRHYPEAAHADRPYRSLLELVIVRQAELIARWLLVGFIHGVMNTDNMSIAGETIDYGPCAFMDEYHPTKVFSSIDQLGRYAYANQPQIATWNLARFAETLLPLIDENQQQAIKQAEGVLERFSARFEAAYLAGMRQKLGFSTEADGDLELAGEFISLLATNHVDFTLAFRRLSDAAGSVPAEADLRILFRDKQGFGTWAERWRSRLMREPNHEDERRTRMRAVNPAFIPRNHRIEAMIEAAGEHEDFAPFEELLLVLAKPFEDQASFARYMDPPQPHERVCQTFCGT